MILLIVKMYEPEEPVVLKRRDLQNQYSSKVGYYFLSLDSSSQRKEIPCSADWVITIVEPIENLKKLYQEKINGRDKGNQSPVIV